MKEIQEIYNIEFCSYTWDKFVNNYVYPKPKVEISNPQKQETSIDTIISQYNKIINTYNSFSIKSETTYKQMLLSNPSAATIEKKFNDYKNVFIQDPIPYEEIRNSMLDQFSKNAKSASPKLNTDVPVDQDKFLSDKLKKLYNFLTVYGILCNLTPTSIKCLTKLLTLGNIEPTISLDVVKTYDYEELKTKILFSLTNGL
jgi:hypothetical protein